MVFLGLNRCNDPFLSPHTTTTDPLVQHSLSELCRVDRSGKISIAEAQRCLDGGKLKEHRQVTLNKGSPSL